MSKRLDEKVGSVEFDGLIVSNVPVTDVASVSLTAGAGIVKRGTIITGTPGGNMSKLNATAVIGDALYVLADDVDTGTDNTADALTVVAYRTGHFNRQELIVDDSYTLTAADEEILRKGGIILSDALKY